MINIDPSNGLLPGGTNQSFENENIHSIKLQIVVEDYTHEIKDILQSCQNGHFLTPLLTHHSLQRPMVMTHHLRKHDSGLLGILQCPHPHRHPLALSLSLSLSLSFFLLDVWSLCIEKYAQFYHIPYIRSISFYKLSYVWTYIVVPNK